jgi:hypothetical protein
MIAASTDELLTYLADLIETAERFGATVLPPGDADDVAWEQDGDDLVLDLATRLPAHRRSRDVDLVLQERWSPRTRDARDAWVLVEYGYELHHHELDYRRALHRHDVEYFVRTYDVATHEHCEATMGHVVCGHYSGQPVSGAIDGFRRLYNVWLSNTKPDCPQLHCLG